MGEVEQLQFKWLKQRGFGGKKKDVRFFQSFMFDYVAYALYDDVYLYKDGEPEPYIGKLIKIWEHADKSKKVKVLWYFRPCEILNFLGTEEPPENELFLASGEGVGLANINPLEAIAGKCNVVCISKDARNSQPSQEELHSADFVFSRTFDVAKQTISENFDDKIAGVDVNAIFNGNQNSSGIPKLDSEKKEVAEQPKLIDLINEERSEQPEIDSEQKEVAENAAILEPDSQKKEVDEPVVVANGELLALSEQNKFEESIPTDKSNTVKHIDKNEAMPGDEKTQNFKLVKQESSHIEKPASGAVLEVCETSKTDNTAEDISEDAAVKHVSQAKVEGKRAKDFDESDSRPHKKVKPDGSTMGPDNKNQNSVLLNPNASGDKVTDEATASGDKSKLKRAKVSLERDNVSKKKLKVDGKLAKLPDVKSPKGSSGKSVNEEIKTDCQILEVSGKPVDTVEVTASEDKCRLKQAKDSVGRDNVSTKKLKVDGKIAKLPDVKSPKGSSGKSVNEEIKTDCQILEVSRKPIDTDEAMGSEDNASLKQAKDSLGRDNVSTKKVKVDGKIAKLPDVKSPKAPSGKFVNEEIKTDCQTLEVSGKPVDTVEAAASEGKCRLKQVKDSLGRDNVSTKKVKVDGKIAKLPDVKSPKAPSGKSVNEGIINDSQTLEVSRKPIDTDEATASEDKSRLKQAKDSLRRDNASTKKLKVDGKIAKLPDVKLPKGSSGKFVNEEIKTDSQTLEVSRKPVDERSKWFKGLPWEERIKDAHENGTLVLLQNLDPCCTSAEVEDIVWHAFKEKCSAKKIQKTALSSPHSGLAFILLKTRDAAEKIVEKLDEGCLMLSNGGPLIASIQNPCFPEKQSTFYGHLFLDKLKYQMQRDMKKAVSTSHCAQPNTLEYDMAVEWRLLQERSYQNMEKLFNLQGKELKALKTKLKSK